MSLYECIFCLDFRHTTQDENQTRYSYEGQQSVAWQIRGPRKEHNAITVPTEHCIKPTTNGFSSHPSISASLKPHQRSLFMGWLMTNTETTADQKQRLSDCGMLSPKWDIDITPPLAETRGLL